MEKQTISIALNSNMTFKELSLRTQSKSPKPLKEHDQTISPQLHVHLWEFTLKNGLSEVFYHYFKDFIYQIWKIPTLCPIFITVSRYLINIHSASTSIFLSDSTEQYVTNWNIFAAQTNVQDKSIQAPARAVGLWLKFQKQLFCREWFIKLALQKLEELF